MISVVVPFRAGGKSRLPDELRSELSVAMLGDVLDAARAVGRVLVVTDGPAGRELATAGEALVVDDPGGGQGAAVTAALTQVEGHALVVNADLPCATPDALRRLAAAGTSLVAAEDGTTNALSVPEPSTFASLYGPGSAGRFAASGFVPIAIPELVLDVDTLDDLRALELPVGRRTALVTDRHKLRLSLVGER